MQKCIEGGQEFNYQVELKIVEGELKQLSIETIELFQQLKSRGVISDAQYIQLIKQKVDFIASTCKD